MNEKNDGNKRKFGQQDKVSNKSFGITALPEVG